MSDDATKRPQNRCGACAYTWFPKGKDVSLQCPKCGGNQIQVVMVEKPRSACGMCACFFVVLILIGLVRGALLKDTPIPVGTPTSLKSLKVDKAGANSIKLSFQAVEAKDEVACDGELTVSVRPLVGRSAGEEIASATVPIAVGDFHRNSFGDPEVSRVVTFVPRAPMPEGASWVAVEVTLRPRHGGAATASERCLHDAIGPAAQASQSSPRPAPPTSPAPAPLPGLPSPIAPKLPAPIGPKVK